MDFIPGPVKEWFGFTRRERRSTFALLIIIIILICVRYFVPEKRISLKDITGQLKISELSLTLTNDTFTPVRENYIIESRTEARLGKALVQKESRYKNRNSRIFDINRCDSASFDSLPGIGAKLSVRIVKYRRLLGGFARIDQLKEVYGLRPETYELIKNKIFADSSFIKRIDINTADYRELLRIHYLDNYEVTAILKYRRLKGNITGLSDLVSNKIINAEKAAKISPYLSCENGHK